MHTLYDFDVRGPDRHTRSGPWLRRRVESLPWHPSSMTAARIRADIQVARDKRVKAEKEAKGERG